MVFSGLSIPIEFFYRVAESHASDFQRLVITHTYTDTRVHLLRLLSFPHGYVLFLSLQKALFEPVLSRVFATCNQISLSSPDLAGCFAVLEVYSRHSELAKVHVCTHVHPQQNVNSFSCVAPHYIVHVLMRDEKEGRK